MLNNLAMMPDPKPYAVSTGEIDNLEGSILAFGKDVFKEISRRQPSTFNKNFWSGRMMQWAMQHQDFKVNMFRLVDVLPVLRSSNAVATHVRQYLSESASRISRLAGWAFNLPSNSLRAQIASFVARAAVRQMASQFIAGESPLSSLSALRGLRRRGFAFTVDLLGEYSLSEPEALHYLERYKEALSVIGKAALEWDEKAPLLADHPGDASPLCVSVKLSALYSQASPLNFTRTVDTLADRLAQIARLARRHGGSLYVDAEDSATNPMIYEAFRQVFGSREFIGFPFPGIVVQAYARGAEAVLAQFQEFASRRSTPIAVRLVKGAYWDQETIGAKQNGWPSPLFAYKESSDANYEELSCFLLDRPESFLPAFASHNVRSLSHACCYAAARGIPQSRFEIQMLYGMADPIAAAFRDRGYLVRMYVPLGEMLPGMGYLVRRLLENTSNESFLRHTYFDAKTADSLLKRPVKGDATL